MICLIIHGNVFQEGSAFVTQSPPQLRSSPSNPNDIAADAPPNIANRHHHTKRVYASKKQPSTENRADFEYQEVKVLTQAMKAQNVKPWQLPADKRVELEGYIRRILRQRPSLVPLDRLQQVLPGTRWRLAFSTEPAVSEALPRDATIQLDFRDDTHVDYSLEFEKTIGLKRLVAKSSYTLDATAANPGMVTIQYESISTDVFGLKNIGVGAFGLLKGRGSYIQTAYFDGRIWIERGMDMNGNEFYNVYTLDKDQN
jgi:hypothetical protein